MALCVRRGREQREAPRLVSVRELYSRLTVTGDLKDGILLHQKQVR